MDRYATFVDSGYVFVAGGELCCGTGDRKRFDLDVPKLRDHLNRIAKRGNRVVGSSHVLVRRGSIRWPIP